MLNTEVVYNIYNVYTNCSITVGHKRGVFPSNPFLEYQAEVVLICQCSSICLSMCQFNYISETAVNIFNIFHMMLWAGGGGGTTVGGYKRWGYKVIKSVCPKNKPIFPNGGFIIIMIIIIYSRNGGLCTNKSTQNGLIKFISSNRTTYDHLNTSVKCEQSVHEFLHSDTGRQNCWHNFP